MRCSPRLGIQSICVGIFCCLFHGSVCAQTPAETLLSKEKAWVGEPIQLTITIFSPGPFSGTPSFGFPEFDGAVVIPKGSPVLGSKTIEGESFLSQRHDFLIVSQRSGELRIPEIEIRYSGKPDFVSDPEEMQATSEAMEVSLERPTEFGADEFVVSAKNFTVEQSWSAESLDESPVEIELGGVIERRITQKIQGSTAMFLHDVSNATETGIESYAGTPEVEDTVERGALKGQRVDTIKYQFQAAGEYEIPSVTYRWWNLDTQTLESVLLVGTSTVVKATTPSTEETSSDQENSNTTWAWILVAAVSVSTILVFTYWSSLAAWFRKQSRSRTDVQEVLRACRS